MNPRGEQARLAYFYDYARRHGAADGAAIAFAAYCERMVQAGSPLSNPRHLRVILAAYRQEAA